MYTFVVCPECGNKRCPKATDHNNPCTNSNDPGQPGSIYGDMTMALDARRAREMALVKPQAELKAIYDRIEKAAVEGHFRIKIPYEELEYLRSAPTLSSSEGNQYIYAELKARQFKVSFYTNFGDPSHVEITW